MWEIIYLKMENYVIKIVPSDHSGQRLDSVIAKLFPDFSRSKLKNWIDSGSVFVNDNPCLLYTSDAADE